MTGAADSEELTGEGAGNGIIAAALDGDSSTYWHTNWNDNSKPKAQYSNGTLTGNNNYTITLDKAYAVKALTSLPKTGKRQKWCYQKRCRNRSKRLCIH